MSSEWVEAVLYVDDLSGAALARVLFNRSAAILEVLELHNHHLWKLGVRARFYEPGRDHEILLLRATITHQIKSASGRERYAFNE